MAVLKYCNLCSKYYTCKIYDKVCSDMWFLKKFLNIEKSDEIAKYCKDYEKEGKK